MTIIEKLNQWADNHQSAAIDILRILSGVFVFYKGLYFMQNSSVLLGVMEPVYADLSSIWLVHYVAMTHLAGGLFVTIGLLTRLAAVLQIPILLGAVIVNSIYDVSTFELLQSLVILLVLAFYCIYGSGKYSADHFLGIGTNK